MKAISEWVFFFLILIMTGCSSRNTPAPVVESKTAISLKRPSVSSIKTSTYRVKKGETLYSIAWRAKTDVRTLAELNKLSSPYKIYPNQKLILASKSTQPIKNKPSANNSIKSSGSTSTKVNNKPVASSKKPAYGGTVSGQKTSKKSASQANVFSQKIRKWQWPARGKVIATFSTAIQGNKGIDIAGRRGDKVKVAADGVVVYAGSALRGYGKLIIVKHNDDYLSAYAHNDQILVKEQQVIKAGNVIAKMGDTDAERVMLHFEVRFRGKSVNPLKYLPKK
ncbi:peptidoglycan DD-metalloendopeptidase family protein [Thalassotalea atypica]|uniref:peptidoglycan DD-metalloendopeptidase family protein n=1 Tax=Thalassotalea atypica TaxID=2054316 RepID=UPI002573024A|nr:peptidoglycan DD-metalloendopeptidase family protein [Thalassotalea atypica]